MAGKAIRTENFEVDKDEEAELTATAYNDLSLALAQKETNKTDYNRNEEIQSQSACLQSSNDEFEAEGGNDTRISEFTYETLTRDKFSVARLCTMNIQKRNTQRNL